MQWTAREFDFISGRYTGFYYDISTINWFVDSDLGDNTNAGNTPNAPFKTLTQAHTAASNGDRIMINGIFTENLVITKQLRIIGCGGGRNGKTIFNNGGGSNYISYTANLLNHSLENVETTNYTTAIAFLTYSTAGNKTITGIVNCILDNIFISQLSTNIFFTFLNFRFCILKNCLFNFVVSNSSTRFYIGNNNTLFNCSKTGGANSRVYITNNNHINNTMEHVVDGVNNIVNTDGQYFSPANNDFNFLSTSPLYQTGTLDGITGVINNVGAGKLGEFYNATSFEYTALGGASFSNTEVSGTGIYRTDDTNPGFFESGVIQLNNGRRRGVVIGIHNSFNFSGGTLTELIQESSGLTVRQGLDCELIIGNSLNEVNTKVIANDWLLYEYGKPVTITVSSGNTYGNAHPNFDPTDFILPAFEYFKIRFRFKDA
jgi:hypothetical protein